MFYPNENVKLAQKNDNLWSFFFPFKAMFYVT